jgi:hypothetical protein
MRPLQAAPAARGRLLTAVRSLLTTVWLLLMTGRLLMMTGRLLMMTERLLMAARCLAELVQAPPPELVQAGQPTRARAPGWARGWPGGSQAL